MSLPESSPPFVCLETDEEDEVEDESFENCEHSSTSGHSNKNNNKKSSSSSVFHCCQCFPVARKYDGDEYSRTAMAEANEALETLWNYGGENPRQSPIVEFPEDLELVLENEENAKNEEDEENEEVDLSTLRLEDQNPSLRSLNNSNSHIHQCKEKIKEKEPKGKSLPNRNEDNKEKIVQKGKKQEEESPAGISDFHEKFSRNCRNSRNSRNSRSQNVNHQDLFFC